MRGLHCILDFRVFVFFFKQKTAYELRISDWSSDVCSSDLQTSDTGAIEAVIAEVIAANADKVAEYRGGKDKLFGFFVGQTMKASGGKANPAVVNELLRKALA